MGHGMASIVLVFFSQNMKSPLHLLLKTERCNDKHVRLQFSLNFALLIKTIYVFRL